jgi:hypothetical protein
MRCCARLVRAPSTLYIGCAVAAIAVGAAFAAARYWTCDDAFISFRYADNLVRGHGLVFNAGERVEGFTNLLWTLWIAVGLRLGASAEAWAGASGIACHAATLALLAWRGWAIWQAGARTGARVATWPLPAAAILAAVHREGAVFATSGLETSAFTLLAFAGYLLVCPAGEDPAGAARRARPGRLAAAGAVLALASLTRPDGALLAAVCGAWLVAGRDLRGGLAFAAGFAALWLPATIARVAYYGDVFPNTYYAKSASTAWWSQGALYARLYFARYWPLALAVPCAALVRPRRAAALELALAAAYAVYVMRVGGDFMFGRLLVPIAPYLVILVERGLAELRLAVRAPAIAGLGAALLLMPSPVDHEREVRGIVDEHDTYTVKFSHWAERADTNGAVLAALFDGLPVSACFFGTQARLVYRSRVATAIECETGLTDATIAHQALSERGRIGHEKHAQLAYLRARGVDFVLARDYGSQVLHLDDQLPRVPIDLGRIEARVITWDPALMARLAARGVRIPDALPEVRARLAVPAR